jgi:hypothetical protein
MTTPMTQAIYHDKRNLALTGEEAKMLIDKGIVEAGAVYYAMSDGKDWQDVHAALNNNRKRINAC